MAATNYVGEKGERVAVQYLERAGYTIIETNWHSRFGEVDIIAKKNNEWIFVEVKTSQGAQFKGVLANITDKKRLKFIRTVHLYLSEHSLDDVQWRIDAIGVTLPKSGDPIISHVEDAFDW